MSTACSFFGGSSGNPACATWWITIYEDDILEEESPLVYQVGSMGPKYGEIAPFYVTLQVNDSLLHDCVFDPDDPTNIMTERIMHQLGLSISQPNTQ
jgi:hypothetical protein